RKIGRSAAAREFAEGAEVQWRDDNRAVRADAQVRLDEILVLCETTIALAVLLVSAERHFCDQKRRQVVADVLTGLPWRQPAVDRDYGEIAVNSRGEDHRGAIVAAGSKRLGKGRILEQGVADRVQRRRDDRHPPVGFGAAKAGSAADAYAEPAFVDAAGDQDEGGDGRSRRRQVDDRAKFDHRLDAHAARLRRGRVWQRGDDGQDEQHAEANQVFHWLLLLQATGPSRTGAPSAAAVTAASA